MTTIDGQAATRPVIEHDPTDALNGAVFSTDRLWRYSLWRLWDRELPKLIVVGLNPSTADEVTNDPTVTRCITYARDWGYGGLWMMNCFAYRATDPQVMLKALRTMPHSEVQAARAANVGSISQMATQAVQHGGLVLVAWGNHARGTVDRRFILEAFRRDGVEPQCLGVTKSGEPKHPLYLRRDAEPRPYQWE